MRIGGYTSVIVICIDENKASKDGILRHHPMHNLRAAYRKLLKILIHHTIMIGKRPIIIQRCVIMYL